MYHAKGTSQDCFVEGLNKYGQLKNVGVSTRKDDEEDGAAADAAVSFVICLLNGRAAAARPVFENYGITYECISLSATAFFLCRNTFRS